MAVNNDNLERDPKLARLLEAASREAPPAALDAAILAAARREVDARPRLAGGGEGGGGGGESSATPVRAKRNWYVPVSIAAVMVLSVSLVTLIHEEKGDELAQPPASASAPAPAAAKVPPAVESEKPDAMLRDASPAKPEPTEKPRSEADNKSIAEPKMESKVAAAPETYAELAKKQRSEKTVSPADGAVASGVARKDQTASAPAREQSAASDTAVSPPVPARREDQADPQVRAPAAVRREPEAGGGFAAERQRSTIGPRSFDGGTSGTSGTLGGAAGALPGAASPPASSPAPREMRPTPEPVPAQAPARDAVEAPPRSESDRTTTRGVIQEAPAPAASPAAPAPQAKAAAPPRPPLWRGLEDQPPEKWLERLAEFKRDNRQADAAALLAEFRRRFPDHPASGR